MFKSYRSGLAAGILLALCAVVAFGARVGTRGPRANLLDPGPSGRAVEYIYDEFNQGVKSDGVLHGGTNVVVDGTTIGLDSGWITTGKCVEAKTEGTWAGTNAAKTVRLTIMDGATAVDLLSLSSKAVTDIGNLKAEFMLCGLSATTYEVWGDYTLSDGGTVVVTNSRANGTYTFNRTGPITVKTRWSSAHGSDTVTQRYGKLELQP